MDPLASPALVAVVAIVVLFVVQWQRDLTYTEYRTAHRIKSRLAASLDSWAEENISRSLVNWKRYREKDDEFIETRDASPKEVFEDIRSKGLSPHLVASTKARKTPEGERQLTHGQLVKFLEESERQIEYYLFDNGDGTTDIYAHSESWVKDPKKHLEETEQRPIDE